MLVRVKLMRRLLLFFLLSLAVGSVVIGLNGIFWNVEPETMDRQALVRVIQLRDFRRFSPEFTERLTHRAEQEFGRHSTNKPVFELPPWEKRMHVYFQTHRSSQQSQLEINLTVMAKLRYFQWMYEYQSAERARKAALMNEVVEEMRYWQTVYFDYVRFLGQPEPTLAELHRDFQRMIENFKVEASPEEVTLIDTFAQDVGRALFAAEVQKTIWNLFLPSKQNQ